MVPDTNGWLNSSCSKNSLDYIGSTSKMKEHIRGKNLYLNKKEKCFLLTVVYLNICKC